MSVYHSFVIRFAELRIRFLFPTTISVPKELESFWVENNVEADLTYEIKLLDKPLDLEEPIARYGGIRVCKHQGGWIRVYSELTTTDGCQVACFINRDKNYNVLYYPAAKWGYYSEELHFLHLLGIEEVLLKNQAILLHSSFVKINGGAVLFSGPSCVGKSTQASLWEKYLGAEVLNGDRCVIRKIDNIFYGCGSPWAGTSGIYRKEIAPVKGIFILRKAKENSIRLLKAEAFVKIYQQCIVNSWNSNFVTGITDLITELLRHVPVYELACRPDEDAVWLAYNTLYEGGVDYGVGDKC